MEYVPGVDLKRLLQDAAEVPAEKRSGEWLANYLAEIAADAAGRESSVLPAHLASATWPEVVAWIGARIADGLSYAHQQNVAHRDIKPANVLLSASGSPKIVDFNIGFGEQVLGAQPEDDFGGTPAYMAPEQRRVYDGQGEVEAVDFRCDIYSLGVVIFELLTGSLPHATQRKSANKAVELASVPTTVTIDNNSLSSVVANPLAAFPVGLQEIVARCLASDASDRPQSADIVARRLQLCCSIELHDFVFARPGSWPATISGHPVLALVASALAPNVFLAALNIAFVDRYVSAAFYRDAPPHWPAAIGYFDFQKVVVNSIVFPLGICAVAWFARPVVGGLQQVFGCQPGRKRPPAGPAAGDAWHCATRLGFYVWLTTLACWIGTGLVFPTWNWAAKLHYTSEGLLPRDFATFLMTQVTFGSMASALSVLGVNFVLTLHLLPVLVRDDYVPAATCLEPIARQAQRMVHWLAFLPQFSLLAVALLIANQNPMLFVILGFVSGGCYACGILYARSIRRAERRLGTLLTSSEELIYGVK
jgi:hypothetical protein